MTTTRTTITRCHLHRQAGFTWAAAKMNYGRLKDHRQTERGRRDELLVGHKSDQHQPKQYICPPKKKTNRTHANRAQMEALLHGRDCTADRALQRYQQQLATQPKWLPTDGELKDARSRVTAIGI